MVSSERIRICILVANFIQLTDGFCIDNVCKPHVCFAAFAGVKTVAKNPLSWPKKIRPKLKKAANKVTMVCLLYQHVKLTVGAHTATTAVMTSVLLHSNWIMMIKPNCSFVCLEDTAFTATKR